MSPRRRLLLAVVGPLVLAVTVLVLVLSGSSESSRGAASPPGATAPLDLATVAVQISDHYHAARAHAAVYRDIPCYCGCEAFLDHRNLYDCFVRADGAGWERHAAGCGVCIAESGAARRLLSDGLDPAAVRQSVMDQFGSTPGTAPQP